ncbi:hypothetical protein A3Q56_08322, partial [Intoshia linei]
MRLFNWELECQVIDDIRNTLGCTIEFVDYQIIKACGGNGGNGFCSFLKLKYNEFAGPDGGDGGNGGHVII